MRVMAMAILHSIVIVYNLCFFFNHVSSTFVVLIDKFFKNIGRYSHMYSAKSITNERVEKKFINA